MRTSQAAGPTTDRRVRRTVRRVRRRWRGFGAPRDVADRLADDLEHELTEATQRGLPVGYVVGDDLTAFAAARFPASLRPDPVRLAGDVLTIVLLTAAIMATLNPLLHDRPTGFLLGDVGVLGLITIGGATGHAREMRRVAPDLVRDAQVAAVIGGVILLVLALAAFVARGGAGFVHVPAAVIAATVAVTAIVRVLLARRARARWERSRTAA